MHKPMLLLLLLLLILSLLSHELLPCLFGVRRARFRVSLSRQIFFDRLTSLLARCGGGGLLLSLLSPLTLAICASWPKQGPS